MKNRFFAILTLFMMTASLIQAQSKYGTDSLECRSNLSVYNDYYKKKNYKDAYPAWLYCYQNCPKSSKNNFIYGPTIVKKQIKATADEAKKEELIQLLFAVYDSRLEHFPGKEGYVTGKKALDMLKYRKEEPKAAYDLFVKAYELDGRELSPAVLNGYFTSSTRLFNKKIFTQSDVFDVYNIVIEAVETNISELNKKINEMDEKVAAGTELSKKEQKALAKAKKSMQQFQDLNGNIEKRLGPIATCEKLQLIYNDETFEAHKDNTSWLKRGLKMLSKERENKEGEKKDCTDDPIFFKMAEALYQLEPSSPAARGMAKMSYKREEYTKAVDYFKQAAEQEDDLMKQADDYLRAAVSYQKIGQLSQARTYAQKAAKSRSGWGEPYLLIAGLYAQSSGSCGSNAFEKKAVYWAAIDKCNYAASVDTSVKEKAGQAISSYKKGLPTRAIGFQLGAPHDGESYTIGCWIQETVTVKFHQ